LMGIVFSSFSCSSSWTLSMPLMGMIFPWCSCCSSWTLSYAPHIKSSRGFSLRHLVFNPKWRRLQN
jgi:hypothetical protein